MNTADGETVYGVLVTDAEGHPEAMLPVGRWDLNGGGGAVLGWLDADTVLFQVYDVATDADCGCTALAWEITSGEVRRVADYAGSRLALAPAYLP